MLIRLRLGKMYDHPKFKQRAKLITNIENKDYSLIDFNKKILDSNYGKTYWEKSHLLDLDLRHCFFDLRLVILRINENIEKMNREFELIDTSIERKLINKEAEEFINLSIYSDYMLLDVKSLFIWINIFLDKMSKYLTSLILPSEKMPSNSGFHDFLRDIKKKFKGNEIDKLTKILTDYEMWYENIKNIRDDYVIHHSKFYFRDVGRSEESIYVPLGTGKIKRISISNEYIDAQLLLFKNLLRDLNVFLCENIESLPFRIDL